MALPSTQVLLETYEPPDETLTVEVTAFQWGWLVRYPDNFTALDELRVAARLPMILKLPSNHVIHSLHVPEIGIKMDAVPGRINENHVGATGPGTYGRHCAKYRGIGRSDMPIRAVVVDTTAQARPYGGP